MSHKLQCSLCGKFCDYDEVIMAPCDECRRIDAELREKREQRLRQALAKYADNPFSKPS